MATFRRVLRIRFTTCSLCILTYCNFSYFHFGFEDGTLVLIASVAGHWLPFTLYRKTVQECYISIPPCDILPYQIGLLSSTTKTTENAAIVDSGNYHTEL